MKEGHLVSIKKIKWFTWIFLPTSLSQGGIHAALSITGKLPTLKASNSKDGSLTQKLLAVDSKGVLTLTTLGVFSGTKIELSYKHCSWDRVKEKSA